VNVTRTHLVWIAALSAGLAAIVVLHEILLPFVAAIALAYLLDPVVERCEQLGVNRTAAALAILSLFFLSLGVLMIIVVPLLGEELAAFIDKFPQYVGQLQALAADPKRPWVRKIIGLGLSEAEQSAAELATAAADWIPSLLRSVWSNSQTLISLFSLLIVTPIITVYLLRDWKHLIVTIDRSIPAARRGTVRSLARELNETVSGFLRGQGTICIILALYYALALHVIGLNHGILIGLTAGLISFVPYLGSFTGLVLSLSVAVLQFWPSWAFIPVVLAIFVAGQVIADYVLAPYLIASRIHLNPVWAMFAMAAFGYLFGFVGLLIAVPLAAVIGVLVRFATAQQFASESAALSKPAAPAPQDEPLPVRKSWFKSLLGK
jgi:predicted PurR-regulated permease PerM